ncbi:MAG: glycosyltransferase [Methanobacterium sp.]
MSLTIIYVGIIPYDMKSVNDSYPKTTIVTLGQKKILRPQDYGRRLKKYLNDKCFDSIIIEYIHNSYYLNYIPNKGKLILDAHDIISDRSKEFKKFNYEGASYEISKKTEFAVFDIYDYVVLLCRPDHQKVLSEIGSKKTLLCPCSIDLTRQKINKSVTNIVFIGSEFIPNRDAIEFFITHCWPKISEKYPVQLLIYGKVCNQIQLAYNPQIVLKGYVSDLDSIYKQADIIINPVRFGAGLKIKNIEALANGVPLITTSHGARGLESPKNKAFIIANEPQEFINAIFSLIEDFSLRLALGTNASLFIENNFSAAKCYRPLMRVIK